MDFDLGLLGPLMEPQAIFDPFTLIFLLLAGLILFVVSLILSLFGIGTAGTYYGIVLIHQRIPWWGLIGLIVFGVALDRLLKQRNNRRGR